MQCPRLPRRARHGLIPAATAAAFWAMLLLAMHTTVRGEAVPPPAGLPNGIAAGDVTSTTVVLWARSAVTGELTFAGPAWPARTVPVLDPTRPVTVTIARLTPATAYSYTVSGPEGETLLGRFRTPADRGYHGLRFGVSGDWRGELAPYPAISNIVARDLDFFVALGDTVYADVPSPAVDKPQAETLAEFRAKHAEVYGTHLRLNKWADVRGQTALFAMVDDHEVMNDYAGGAPAAADPRFPESVGLINESGLYARGMQAFAEYNPLDGAVYGDVGDDRMTGRPKLYRHRIFGDDAALFLLDARSFRDAPIAPVQSQFDIVRFLTDAFTPGRTLLGTVQSEQLKADLRAAQARGVTWKFVMVPEPVQNLGPVLAEDRFEGYAAERAELLAFIEEQAIENVVFVAADIHGTMVNNITYQLGVGQAQRATGAFEVTTGAVAYDAPFGPTLVDIAVDVGLISPAEKAAYDALTGRTEKDAFVRGFVDELLALLGYDTLGLVGANIDATLVSGDYVALHTFGWTEFAIDAQTQQLTVTTFGIDPYTLDDLRVDPAGVTSREPTIVSRFVVTPTRPARTPQIFLPLLH